MHEGRGTEEMTMGLLGAASECAVEPKQEPRLTAFVAIPLFWTPSARQGAGRERGLPETLINGI